MMNVPWRIELFGRLCARQGAQEIARFRTQKTGTLLAYLACYREQVHPRDALIEMLWPEHDLDAARNSLSVALSSLRRQLEPPGVPPGSVLIADRLQVRLNPAAVTTDVADFDNALQVAAQAENEERRCASLQCAVALYRGELLPGHYEEWVTTERDRLRDAYLAALRQLIRSLAQARDYERALDYAHRAVAADPLREESHRNLMRLYMALGRPAEAREQYRELSRLLQAQLGVDPSAATRELVEQLAALSPQRSEPPRHRDTEVAQSRTESRTPDTEHRAPRLPMQFTRFFGREEEIARLTELLRRESGVGSREGSDSRLSPLASRLVTLTGPGGTGKTRLAIETASRLAGAFPGGIWFVPLADLTDARLIPGAIAESMGLERSLSVEPLEQVVGFLNGTGAQGQAHPERLPPRAPEHLLLLDNFEHLLEGGAHILQALRHRVPALTLLVTSRCPLELPGEQEFPVSPLPTPEEGAQVLRRSGVGAGTEHLDTRTPEGLMQYPGIQLFVDRAQARRADFQITPGNAGAVAALCAKLEGLPLAIELAAARARVLTPVQMLAHLTERFDLLAMRRADKGERHRSLWAAIEWSYRLLAPDVQQFFTRLSVFRGGWSLEAAEAVAGAQALRRSEVQESDPSAEQRTLNTGALHSTPYTLDFLSQLRGHSLILADEETSAMRFRMLESLREFAGEQLSEEEREALAERHAAYFLDLAEQAQPHLNGIGQAAWLKRLETEHDNFRAALEWCLGKSRVESRESREEAPSRSLSTLNSRLSTPAEQGLRLAGSLARFWEIRSHFTEGREWLRRALEQTRHQRTPLRGKALIGAGHLAYNQGDYAEARALYEESRAICRETGISPDIAIALSSLGNVAYRQGDYVAARALYEESRAINRALGNRWGIASSLGNLANVAQSEGDLSSARRLNEESLTIWQELGDHKSAAYTLNNLANVAQSEGDLAGARALHEESLRIKRTLGDRASIGNSLANLGLVAVEQGDFSAASACLQESLTIARELGDKPGIANILDSLALLADAEAQAGIQHPESRNARAACLWAASEALREEIGYPRPPAEGAEHEARQARARAALGEAAFAAAWAQGRAMTLEQALECALNAPPESG